MTGLVLSVTVAVMAATGGSGCSLVFSEGPPPQHERMPYFDCTSTYGLSVADGFIGAGSAIGAIATLAAALAASGLVADARPSGAAAAMSS